MSNIVLARPRRRLHGMGQDDGFLPFEMPITDVTTVSPTVDSFPDIYDPGLQAAIASGGAPTIDPTGQTGFLPSTMTITPAGSTSPLTAAVSALAKGLAPGPSPRVSSVPTSLYSSPFSSTGLPSWFWLVAAGGALLLLASGGRRR